MTTRRIAVIGLGQRIAHVLAAMKEVGWDLRLDGYVDEHPVGASILDAAGILPGRPFETPEALLAAGPYDLVMIGTPNHLHLTHLEAAFAAGYPIFCEKPIVRTVEVSRPPSPGASLAGLSRRSSSASSCARCRSCGR